MAAPVLYRRLQDAPTNEREQTSSLKRRFQGSEGKLPRLDFPFSANTFICAPVQKAIIIFRGRARPIKLEFL